MTLTDAPPTPPRRKRGRPVVLTDAMLEDLRFMAAHGEGATGAADRISRHTDAPAHTITRDKLLATLRRTGHRGLAAQLLDADPLSDVALADSESAARVLALAEARAARRRMRGA